MALIDISPLIDCASPVYPGDVSLGIRVISQKPAIVSAFEMTPHLGAHVDAPLHVGGMTDVSQLVLETFVGPCQVIDCTGIDVVEPSHLSTVNEERVLIKTSFVMGASWQNHYPHLTSEAVRFLAQKGVKLIGIDSPSIDPVDDVLAAHHEAIDAGVVILENLRLLDVQARHYRLIALPLAIRGLEASPVRAILED